MSNDVSRVPYHNGSSSYSPSCVSPQGNTRGISHAREHGNKVQESNLRINPSGHDSIGNNLQCGGIPHGASHPIYMQNMEDGTMNHCSVPPSDTNDLRHSMSNNASQVLNHNVSSSYSQSRVSPQGNLRGIGHV